jgi:hypothetical protein
LKEAERRTALALLVISSNEIVPGAPAQSQLFDRISRRDVLQMPPICTKVVDDPGVALVRKWIMTLPSMETTPPPIHP